MAEASRIEFSFGDPVPIGGLPIIKMLTASPEILTDQSRSIVSWETENANDATLNGLEVALNGQEIVQLYHTNDFTLIASNQNGSVSKTISIEVRRTHILPDAFQTPWDLIPNFAKNYTHMALKNGYWHDPTIWSSGYVPDDYSIVYIPKDITVTILKGKWGCWSLIIFGALLRDPNENSELELVSAIVAPNGAYIDGTVETPVRADRQHSLTFRDIPTFQAKEGERRIGNNIWNIQQGDWDPIMGSVKS